jgi:hypothetical protein
MKGEYKDQDASHTDRGVVAVRGASGGPRGAWALLTRAPRRGLEAAARGWGSRLGGALALSALLCAFLWTPLSRYDEVHFSPADLTQDFLLTKVTPQHQPGNRLLSDAVTQMQPWALFNREELRAGRFPLWNPMSGTGAPHFANYQSAVLSPFTVPFYVLDFKPALLVSAFLKLFALGFLTFLFLQLVGLRWVAALVGATAFMFSGHNVLLLGLPHVGSLVALPGGLLFAEAAIQRAQRGERRTRIAAPLVALSLTLTAGLLAGNPEPFYFAVLLLSAYVAARLLALAVATRRAGRPLAPVLRLTAALLLSGLIGGALAAPQVLPFFEYLENSRLYEQRSGTQTALDSSLWALAFFPDVLGNPSSVYNLSYQVPPPNYELVHMAYVGGTALFLAALSVLFALRDRRLLFFLLAAGVWWVYAHDVLGSWRWFALLPSLEMAPINRSQGLWTFCMALIAAMTVHHLLVRPARRRVLSAGLSLLAGAGVLALFRYGAALHVELFAAEEGLQHRNREPYVSDHLRVFSLAFGLAAGAVAMLWIARGAWLRNALGALILAALFLQTGYHFKDYNSVSEDRHVFPVTEAVAALRAEVGAGQLAILGEDQLLPATNLVYGISTVVNYDGMWVRDYDHLYRDSFGDSNNWRPILGGSIRMLQVFGVEYVLARWGWPNIDTGLARLVRGEDTKWFRQAIQAEEVLSQTFRSFRPYLSAVAVHLSAPPAAGECQALFQLYREDTGELVHEATVTAAEVRSTLYERGHVVFASEPRTSVPGRPVVFPFRPQVDSEDAVYRIVLRIPEGQSNESISAWSARPRAYGEGRGYRGERELLGDVLFDYAYERGAFERLRDIEEFVLYRLTPALGKYHVAGGALVAESEQEVLDFLRLPTFDPRRLVILGPVAGERSPADERPAQAAPGRLLKRSDSPRVYLLTENDTTLVHIEDEVTFLANRLRWDQIEVVSAEEFWSHRVVEEDIDAARAAGLRVVAPEESGPGRLTVLEETPTRARLEIEREQPGYLVVAKTHYPGWKARVNGQPRAIMRANFAFDALELQQGLNRVELYYAPDSLRYGLYIAGGALLLGIAALLLAALVPGRAAARDPGDA